MFVPCFLPLGYYVGLLGYIYNVVKLFHALVYLVKQHLKLFHHIMSQIQERLIAALKEVDLTNPALERKTGIKDKDWVSVRNKRVRVNEDHIEGLKLVCPQYIYWIMTGETIPDAGQISPELEETRQKLNKAG